MHTRKLRFFHACLLAILLGAADAARAYTLTDADTIFTAYNNMYLVGGYYNGWWTGAEEIEMAEDAYEHSPTVARQTIVSNACVQFISHHGSNWTASGGNFNSYNDDISWAVIAFSRGYLITGSGTFLNVAKSNWDAMYNRAWDTNFTGGGLWWSTANTYKNAAVQGPAAIGACLLYTIYGDSSYLTKAQAIYAWERRVLLNTGNGSIADGINLPNTTTSGGATTYNQGTFIGAANFLYRITGLPNYYQDAVRVGKYTQLNMSSAAGIMPEYSSGTDLSGFNGIFARWMARFAKEQGLWAQFGPWLTTNANGAWNVRNTTNNLAWQKWATPMGTNAPNDWGCAASVVVMQVSDASPGDGLQISPLTGFTAVAQRGFVPNTNGVNLVLTNISALPLAWTLMNTSAWLNVSQTVGILAAASPSTNVTVSLVPAATTNLPPGRYYASVLFTNVTSGVIQARQFLLVVSAGNVPLLLSGLNASAMAPGSATAAAPGATAFDIPNSYCLYEAGVNGSTRGLPPDGTFTSAADGTSVYQFAYGVTNTLILGYTYPSSATLTFPTPQAYNSISLLACSANTATSIGTLVLNFTNGTHSPTFNFNAQDWFATTTNNVAITGFGRMKISVFGTSESGATNPTLFQTAINLAAMGSNQMVSSITFNKPVGAGAQQTTGIFAISGAAMPPAPAISVQPQSIANVQPAQGATFNAMAMGAPPLAYQWYYSVDGSPGSYSALADQTNTSLTLNPVLQPSNGGSFVLVVTNDYGAVTSSVATLSVYRAPVIAQSPTPTNVFLFSGAAVTFSVTANAALPANYYWYANGNLLPSQTTSNCVLANVQVASSGSYSVIVSNSYGMVTSSAAMLTVAPYPAYPYGQAVLADHPLGYWRLDETGGSIAHDYLRNSNGVYTPKVLVGQTGDNLVDTHKAAKFGSLSTSNSCVTNIVMDFATTYGAEFSVEAWVNGGAQTTDAGVITKGYGSGGEQFNLDCGGGSHAFRFFVRDISGNTHGVSSSVTPNSQWHHLVGVCDQTNGWVYLYVDGASAGSSTIGTNSGLLSSTLPVTFGARQSGANTPLDLQFVGSMEEVAIYNYALSAAQVHAHYVTATNRAPVFVSNPFTVPGIVAGQSYAGTMAANASDPNGDTVTFAKVSGPAWLSLSGTGGMTGTPLSGDVGTNSFTVSASDPSGLSNTATMNLVVTAAPPLVATAAVQGGGLVLNWSGGIAPYQLQEATNLTGAVWQNVGAPMSGGTYTIPATNDAMYFRLMGQ